MNPILTKYGKDLEPILSVGAGYQIYFPRLDGAERISVGSLRQDTMGKTDSQVLFKQSPTGSRTNAENILGFYPGNYILSERYRDDQAGYLSTSEANTLVSKFRTQQAGKATTILDEYLGGVRPDFKNIMPDAIKTSAVDAGEEQYRAVSGTKAAKGKHGAKSVDLVNVPEFGNVQVTTEKLTHAGHHGLYGKHHKAMQTGITAARRKFKSHKNEKRLHKEIAEEGLKYFKNSVPTWNKALASVKKEMIKAGMPTNEATMSKEIRDIKADKKYDRVGKKAISRMTTSAAHFQTQQASKIVLQALGNLQYFGDTGVMYSYQLEPYVYAAFGQFIMNPETYQFDTSRLNVARIVSGVYDITDMQYSLVGDAQSVAMQRAFANNQYRITGTEGKTKANEINSGHAGGQFGNSARFMSSIDMVHADKEMHKLITKGIIPEVKKHLRKSGEYYGSNKLSKFSDRVPFKRGFGWALPYISVFDTAKEKFDVDL